MMRALLIFPLFILLPLSLSAAPGEVSEEGGAEEAEEVVKLPSPVKTRSPPVARTPPISG